MRGSFARRAVFLLLPAALMLSSCIDMDWSALPTSPEPPNETHYGSIAGHVFVAGTAQPVGGVSVYCWGARDYTSADGAYRLSGVPSGSRTMWAYEDGYKRYQGHIEVRADVTTTRDIELTPTP